MTDKATALKSLAPGVEVRDIPGYEGLYYITDTGVVISMHYGYPRELKSFPIESGYHKLRLKKDGVGKSCYVHRLLAHAFIGDPTGMDINHKDGDKSNNVLGNIEIVSRAENMAHARENGLHTPSKNSSHLRRALSDEQVIAARAEYIPKTRGYGPKALAKKYGVSETTMENVLSGLTYKEVAA